MSKGSPIKRRSMSFAFADPLPNWRVAGGPLSEPNLYAYP
jgi:hypothetical protein